MLLILENRDSFTFNLAQLFRELGQEVLVQSSRTLDVEGVIALAPSHVVLGPGPGVPAQAGCTQQVIRNGLGRTPLLGICLGHQALGTALGARLTRSSDLAHGQTRLVEHDSRGLFCGLPQPLRATRYNSLALDPSSLPSALEVSARSSSGEIMGIRHRTLPMQSVQFHPEAIRSEHGRRLLANFLVS